jgi:DNA-binding transcriptional LysR family regulator
MTIQQCKYVLEIARTGSFSEAAKQLFLAQSSISISVKALETELNIKIFERSGNGVYLTEEGAEFVRYARHIVQQSDFIANRYTDKKLSKRLYVATQHYDFVADTFGKLVSRTQESCYRFALREMRTYDVIAETETAFSDVGVIAIKGSEFGIMERYLHKKRLSFTPIVKVKPHVFLRKEHPLAKQKLITAEQLKDYPGMSYEQGEHSTSFFTEEIVSDYGDKQVQISDRASFMNLLMNTDCYNIGTGILRSSLDDGRVVSIPYESDDHYVIGYILRMDKTVSDLTKTFLEKLIQNAKHA